MKGSLQLIGEDFGIHIIIKERHVHVDLILLVVDGVAILEQDVAVIVVIALGSHQFEMADRCARDAGISDFNTIILLAYRRDEAGCLKFKGDCRSRLVILNRVVTVSRFEKFLKVCKG